MVAGGPRRSLADNCAPPIDPVKIVSRCRSQRPANALNTPDRQACTPHGVSVHKPNRGRLRTVSSPRANCDPTTATAMAAGACGGQVPSSEEQEREFSE